MNPEVQLDTLASLSDDVQAFVFLRALGTKAQLLLHDPTFEPHVPEQYRQIAAASLDSAWSGGYWLTQATTGHIFLASCALIITSRRPANPYLCLTFWHPQFRHDQAKLVTLLLFNEFQMPLGALDHAANRLILYQHQSLAEARRFYEREAASDVVESLLSLSRQSLLQRFVDLGPKHHAVQLCFNKSFGHSHWNDVLGLLHLRRLDQQFPNSSLLTRLLIGPQQWLPDLVLPRLSMTNHFKTTELCTDDLVSTQTSVHAPIGFSIGKDYEQFWKYEVTSTLLPSFKYELRAFRHCYWPIVSLNLRFSEWWRTAWLQQAKQVLDLINALQAQFPSAGFLLDGLTEYAKPACQTVAGLEKSEQEQLLRRILQGRTDCLLLADQPIAAKVAAYQIADYGISQFGSGDTIGHWVYNLPSITISAEPDIIRMYSQSEIITRKCKPSLERTDEIGCFLPHEFLDVQRDGFILDLKTAAPFIINHMCCYAFRPS